MSAPDPRLNAYREDLADARLAGRVEAQRFVEGRPARVAAAVADMHGAPRPDAGVASQLVRGQEVCVFEECEGWAWVQALHDSYVGYVAAGALGPVGPAATHIVWAPRSFVYPGPDLKLPVSGRLSMGSLLTIEGHAETRGTRYALLASGEAVIAHHLRPSGEAEPDYVEAAERLVFTPYLWGGASGFGLDCSGLAQLAMRMAGRAVPRDSDMQAAGIGTPLEAGAALERGDLVFWKGHVAILTDARTVVHASGHRMMVCREPLAEALRRIGAVHGEPTGYRRP